MSPSLIKAVYHFLAKKKLDTPTLTHLLKNWCEIVGDDLSLQAVPTHYSRDTLTIGPCHHKNAKEPIDIEYKKSTYKQKINVYYGRNVVVHIRVRGLN